MAVLQAQLKQQKQDSAQIRSMSVENYVRARIKELGASEWELMRNEWRVLAKQIDVSETIGGIVYGHNYSGHIMLVATDRRVLIIDAKPIYNNVEDITYMVVAGVSLRRSRVIQRLTLHTRLGDFSVQTFNAKAANGFESYINQRGIMQKEAQP